MWAPVERLQAGDVLVLPNGRCAEVLRVERRSNGYAVQYKHGTWTVTVLRDPGEKLEIVG